MRSFVRLGLCLVLLSGCEEEEVVDGSATTAKKAPRKPKAEVEKESENDLPPPVDFQETAFLESERSRDPFRNFSNAFINEARGQVQSQRKVILEEYSIDELKLVAIIGRIHPPRAMLVDPTGVGHVVIRGQFVGRATVIQPTGGVGAAYEVNWRVDRIRNGDMVLVRDDPSNSDMPSATRVVVLRTEEVSSGDRRGRGEGAPDVGLEGELKKMQERLATMAATESARKRSEKPANP